MQVMILNVSSGKRKDNTPYFKAMVSPQDSEGQSATSMEFYIEPEDFAKVASQVPCLAESGYKLRSGRNARNFEMMEITFSGFSDIRPMIVQETAKNVADLPKPSSAPAKSA